jgi:glucose dehydrogenase
MAAELVVKCDVAIVGSGFSGALIANELGKASELGKANVKVVILEAGEPVPDNINAYMHRFYKAHYKVPESPYSDVATPDGVTLIDPGDAPAGRPTVLSTGGTGGFGDWRDPKQSYLIQKGRRPFASTYDRVAGGTSHWLGTCLRLVPADFRMKTHYGKTVPQFVDWPNDIDYEQMARWYAAAEWEIGVSANVATQKYCGVDFPADYNYPMPEIPNSLIDQQIDAALENLAESETDFLGMAKPPTKIPVRAVPAARNSQPFKSRRACAGNTNCIPICPIQAKYDPTITLKEARNTGFVTIMDRTVAYDVVVGDNGNVRQIKFKRYGDDHRSGHIEAKIYIIAANAIETPRLLLMSRNGQGVANSSGMVGRHLMDHPYYVAWGLLPESKRVFPYRGPLITSGIGDLCDGPYRAQRAAFRVDIGNEGWNFVVGGFGGDPNVTTRDFVNGLNKSCLNTTAISGLPQDKAALFGAPLAQTLNNLISRQFRIGFLVEQTPDEDNRVTLSDVKDGLGLPRPQICYDLSDYTRRGIVAAYRMKNLIFRKLGVTKDFTVTPDSDPSRFEEEIDGDVVPLRYTGAGHIMGTYRMGDDPDISVVNSFQQSHDHKNLYLVGSGTFPTGATANPTLTLAALALRTADHLVNQVLR